MLIEKRVARLFNIDGQLFKLIPKKNKPHNLVYMRELTQKEIDKFFDKSNNDIFCYIGNEHTVFDILGRWYCEK